MFSDVLGHVDHKMSELDKGGGSLEFLLILIFCSCLERVSFEIYTFHSHQGFPQVPGWCSIKYMSWLPACS